MKAGVPFEKMSRTCGYRPLSQPGSAPTPKVGNPQRALKEKGFHVGQPYRHRDGRRVGRVGGQL